MIIEQLNIGAYEQETKKKLKIKTMSIKKRERHNSYLRSLTNLVPLFVKLY